MQLAVSAVRVFPVQAVQRKCLVRPLGSRLTMHTLINIKLTLLCRIIIQT